MTFMLEFKTMMSFISLLVIDFSANIRVLHFATMMNFLFYDENGSYELIRMLVKRYPGLH